jgi:2-oxoglutarate ferredoxin oxidoreductase subunit alpha
MTRINDLSVNIASVNGSGSQSANRVVVKALFRMGLPVSGKNIFPSNIQGLPTWFQIRVHPKSFLSRRANHDVVVGFNKSTLLDDLRGLRSGGLFIVNGDFGFSASSIRKDVVELALPVQQLLSGATASPRLKKLLANLVYVGALGAALDIDLETLRRTVADQFREKANVVDANISLIEQSHAFALSQLAPSSIAVRVQPIVNGNDDKMLIDGNTAAAWGALCGGCTFLSWYPITPSTSLAESFTSYAKTFRGDGADSSRVAVVQAEDELSAVSMVLGAGWAGSRAMTCTSGPGLSLMSEAVGLGYFGEVPAVIWDVQRVGPSTGLPTRTQQGDLLSAFHLSHGDTQHVVLLPADPEECFEFAQTAFDLAEQIQTPVLVLSDLDLGMNDWIAPRFRPPQRPFQRGKVLHARDLESRGEFARYLDEDGDGIAYRTLPGTSHPKAAYFTRGTGHDEKALYSEDNEVYARNMLRLRRKLETARSLAPAPVIQCVDHPDFGVIAYGSTDQVVEELRDLLRARGQTFDYLRLRALPPSSTVGEMIARHDRVYVVEQNRDAQLSRLLRAEFPSLGHRLRPITVFDGLPLDTESVLTALISAEEVARG